MSDPTQPFPPGEIFRHTEFLRRLARGLLRDEQAAEVVAQDAFVLALERPPEATGSLAGWLARVARKARAEGAGRLRWQGVAAPARGRGCGGETRAVFDLAAPR